MKPLFKSDGIKGTGVYSNLDIEVGEKIIDFSGPLINRGDLPRINLNEKEYYLQIGTDLFLGPSGLIDDYFNHSCYPNATVIINGTQCYLSAYRHIPAGQEIEFDYAITQENFPYVMDCMCGSPICRGEISDFSRLPAELKKRYADLNLVPDYIK